MPVNSSETSNKSNNFDLKNIDLASSSSSSITSLTSLTLTDVDTSNFTIAANTNTNLGYYFNQEICLFDALYFQKRESNILIINYNKALIWDENVSRFKIVEIKNFDYNLVETNEKYDSTSNNITFNSHFTNSAQIFLTLLLEQNDLVFIDTEKNKNYKFCSKIKKWILLDSKSFFNIEFENDIKIFDIKNQNNDKKILIEKKSKLNFLNTGFIYPPYVPLGGTVTITENINNNNRIYNSDLLSRYALGVDTANNNYLTTSLSHT